MTGNTIGGADTHVVNRAVWVEPAGGGSAVVFQRIRYEGGNEVETKTPFASLSEALSHASKLCQDEDREETLVLQI